MFKTVSKIVKHIACVQEAMTLFTKEIQHRADAHDASKFGDDELEGFARFEDMPEGLEYGSDEYEAAMAKVMEGNNCFQMHSLRNDHHPEYWDAPEQGVDVGMMGLFPLIEMVSDWAGAHKSYGNTGGWDDSVKKNMAKHNFSDSQKWVIYEVADFLRRKMPELTDTPSDAMNPSVATD